MTKWILAAGAAALAIFTPALAQHGGGHGGGKSGGGGTNAANVQSGGGGGKARAAKADRGGGNVRAARADRGGGNVRAARVDRGGGNVRVAKAERGGGHVARADRGSGQMRVARADRGAKVDRGTKRQMRSVQQFADRGHGAKHAQAVRLSGADRVKMQGRNVDRVVVSRNGDNLRVGAVRVDDRFDRRLAGGIRTRGLIDGCPPGLAKKYNGCMPPGLANQAGLTTRALGLGAIMPATYYGTRVIPTYYRDYDQSGFNNLWLDNDDYYYRYGDGNVYRVDRYDNMVAGLIPLLGGGYSVGQPYPLGYGVYNVPYQYRPYYYDTSDSYYRYGDGGIYQVNRSTGLIQAIVSLLAGGLSVGQPLPLGYDAYNMPLAYRTTYYDTPNSWYRYNDGYVYQVDPRTRLVQQVIVI
jgi:hypothetical protein